MARQISTQLKAHLAQEVTSLCTCWEIVRRDGVTFRFTDLDRDLLLFGDTYLASVGYSRTAISSDASFGVDNLDLEGIFDDDSITEEDLRAGLFDFAEVRVFMVNYEDVTQGILRLRRGYLGEVQVTPQGTFRAELRGMAQRLSQRIGEVYTAECRADLGDRRCKIPIQPPVVQREAAYRVGDYVRVATGAEIIDGNGGTQEIYENRIYRCVAAGTTAEVEPAYDTTVGQQTTDGSAVFEAMEAWTRHAAVTEVLDNGRFRISVEESRAVSGWFNGGGLHWETGFNRGQGMEIKDWDLDGTLITLFLPMGREVRAGDRLRLYPGCDKRIATCRAKFDNHLNFRGEPHVPGSDAITTYPDAKT